LGDWDGCLFWVTLLTLILLGLFVAGVIILFFMRFIG
jgi:hypothetical protein